MHRCRRAAAVIPLVLLAGCATSVVDGHPGRTAPSGHSSAEGPSGQPTPPVPAAAGAAFADPAAVARVVADVKTDLVASSSYDYRTLAASLRTGLAHTTGVYRAQFRSAFLRIVEPEARRLEAAQRVQVNVVGVGSLAGSRATVLVSAQTRVTQRSASPRISPTAVVADLDEVGGHWLLSGVATDGGLELSPGLGGAALTAAGTAASSGVRDVQSFRRAHFAADYARALAATTGSLHRALVGKRVVTRSTVIRLHADLYARVVGVGAVSARGATARFLVTARSYKSTAPNAPVQQTLEVTVQRVGDRWLLSSVAEVGLR